MLVAATEGPRHPLRCTIHLVLHSIRQVGLNPIPLFTLINFLFNFLLYYSFYHLGNVYIADSSNSRIRKVTVSTGIITTIAVALYYPRGIAVDSIGRVCLIRFDL